MLASPRHLLLEEAIAKHQLDDWTHIRPRRPRNTVLQEWSADRGLDYLKWMRKKAQTEQKPIHTNQFDILCHRHDEANKLASQNWNVIQNGTRRETQNGIRNGPRMGTKTGSERVPAKH